MARVLGATRQGQGFLHGNGYVVTWAIGHLVGLAQPHEMRPEWKFWRREQLPMLPHEWPLIVQEQTKDQYEVVRKVLTSEKVGRVICATDAGREGELIFRYIYEAAGSHKPVQRLWISSLTPDAIRAGFDKLKDGHDYDPLADAARGRSRADWLVGMNLSRAYGLATNEKEISVGRVQTPTLAMVVERELAIRAFVPEDYAEVIATFSPGEGKYQGVWFRKPGDTRLPPDGVEAKQIVERAKQGKPVVESLKAEDQRAAPPLLYDLTELQRHANRLYGFSAMRTLELAQSLYEKYKLISYPRTDSRHLSQDVAQTLPNVVAGIRGAYAQHVAPGTAERPLGKRFVDDAKVSDHHAIIPTTTRKGSLPPEEDKVYDLICRRLLMCWHEEHIWSVTTVITAIDQDKYHSSGTLVKQLGWKVLDIAIEKKVKKDEPEQKLPDILAEGQPQQLLKVEAVSKKTRPPKRFTEATLLTAMETAGKTLDEKELSDAMKENGLGTPATRAQIIEVLLKRNYITREGKMLTATDKGIRLIDMVHPEVKSPIMTGQWEYRLKQIEKGKAELAPFLKGIEDYVTEVVGKAFTRPKPPAPAPVNVTAAPPAPPPVRQQPTHLPNDDLNSVLHTTFGHPAFRVNQEAVCRALMDGQDALLVMPTGAGKSLCYQLPGVAMGGTTIVISPLIALMEDQVAKMKKLGLAVECIHSGRDRAVSRQVCIDYLAGNLQFLYIAPERLRVPGFPEMLAKRKPCLVAIDEAHCISQWGHDFRPDYRTIGQYLPNLRPARVIALTATATPIVQNDIATQLGLGEAQRFIHGFRRDNIAIEAVEALPSRRGELTREILSDPDCRPAIVYAPTRKEATALAALLSEDYRTAPYHAGMEAEKRARSQEGFLSGQIEVVVATIAFGMGIDKADVRTVIHTALPGSIEAYYQEIGRAGRDGLPSRAILMHHYIDRKKHDFFFERDYPDVTVLENIFGRLTDEPVAKEFLQHQCRMDPDTFDCALEKLWIHGGALVDYTENVTCGHNRWRQPYVAQSEQKTAQLEAMLRFTRTGKCRMCALVHHFGDRSGSLNDCGICDFCAPGTCLAQQYRKPNAAELDVMRKACKELEHSEGRTTGRLHQELCADGVIDRTAFEELLNAMARSGMIDLVDDVFEKNGRSIPYRKAVLVEDADADAEIRIVATQPGGKRKRPMKAAAKAKTKAVAAPKPVSKPKPAAAAVAGLTEALKQWRLSEAKRLGVPAFRVMSDAVMRGIAETEPRSTGELLEISGIGLKFVEKYGARIFQLVGAHVR